jgi:DNA-binding SARP family transcriptional activator
MGRLIESRPAVSRVDGSKPVMLNLLGGFEVRTADLAWHVPDSSRRLLVYLALCERPQCRTLVAGLLWPDKPETRASANLRAALWRLPDPDGLPLVGCNGSNLHLSEHLIVDVRVTEALGWSLVEHPGEWTDRVDAELFLVELLPGWYDDWVIFERERIAQLHLRFLEALVHALVEQGRLTRALDVALRLVNVDPLREASQRALLAVYAAEGSRGEARRQYERYRELIRDTFGCEPSRQLRSMALGC